MIEQIATGLLVAILVYCICAVIWQIAKTIQLILADQFLNREIEKLSQVTFEDYENQRWHNGINALKFDVDYFFTSLRTTMPWDYNFKKHFRETEWKSYV